jgi:hypothetical protein
MLISLCTVVHPLFRIDADEILQLASVDLPSDNGRRGTMRKNGPPVRRGGAAHHPLISIKGGIA